MTVEITTFVPAEKPNPYTDAVQNLADATESNPNAAATITVPKADAAKESLLFQKAANAIGKTARKRLTEELDKGKAVRITFTLTEKHAQRRGK